jgi:hypothetical protein
MMPMLYVVAVDAWALARDCASADTERATPKMRASFQQDEMVRIAEFSS